MAVAIDFDAVPCAVQSASVRPFDRSPRATVGRPVPSVEFSCLVVTGDAALRRRLSAAAELVGWDTAEAGSTAAFAAACKQDRRLVVVDLASPPEGDRDALNASVKELVSRPDTLLVVCGVADDPSQETWARSLGAFVFVPGIAAGDPLVTVFREARNVSERRHAPSAGLSSRSASRLACVRG